MSHIPDFRDRPGVVARFRSFVLRHPGLKRGEKLLAAQLLDCLSLRRWQCCPSRALLAERLGVTVRTVSRALRVLKAAGLFRWMRRRRRPSDYFPNLALVDRRYSAPSGSAVDDAPYGFGNRAAWRAACLATAPGRIVQAQLSLPEPEPEVPKLGRLSAAALRLCGGVR